ncbi:MAG: A/G-specific adenine glycosylase [Clostridiales bacterium]|nr:A/G-specific adenine glycosylase [Clostridiales bacterium]
MPWRESRAPYGVWVSEVMLQQTRASVVAGYYVRFMRALPDVRALADADERTLFKLWEGLGYYGRARNLQKAARIVAEKYGGAFPCAYEQLSELPGVGAYTAGAVASICFNLPSPAVDGNVFRVAARLLNEAWAADDLRARRGVGELLKPAYEAAENRGVLTESLMELGAVVCVPKNPRCGECPVRGYCAARGAGNTANVPLRKGKAEKPVEQLTVFILSRDGKTAVRKRGDGGLLKGLWEFPNVAGALDEESAARRVGAWGCEPAELLRSVKRRHEFTHKVWEMTGYYMELRIENGEVRSEADKGQGEAGSEEGNFVWAAADELERDIPLPSAFKLFL